MPRTAKEEAPKWEMPDVFIPWPEDWQPKRTDFGRLQFPCPVDDWGGHLTLKWNIGAPDYLNFFQQALESPEVNEDDDPEHYAALAWKTRYHLIASINLTNGDGKELETEGITKDPETIPDMRLLIWFTSISQEVLIHATNLPNLPRPSRDTLSL